MKPSKAKAAILMIISASLMFSSCVVTKKRYDTAVMNGKKSLDSLNKVFDETVAGFNRQLNTVGISNSGKDLCIDSLIAANNKLTGDKQSLNQSLLTAISDYNAEKEKLVRKSRTVDSLMRIIEEQKAQADSIAAQAADTGE